MTSKLNQGDCLTMTVKRYDFGTEYKGNTGVPAIVGKVDGRYVSHDDYAALAAHNELLSLQWQRSSKQRLEPVACRVVDDGVLTELLYAHRIIRNALNVMTPEQKETWAQMNQRDGCGGDGTTRANERLALLEQGHAASQSSNMTYVGKMCPDDQPGGDPWPDVWATLPAGTRLYAALDHIRDVAKIIGQGDAS